MLTADRALLVAGHDDLSASMAGANVLARFAKCVLILCEADDALTGATLIVISI